MVHPEHGVLHAVGSEVKWNLENGWKIEEKDAGYQHVGYSQNENLSNVTLTTTGGHGVVGEVAKKRGRPAK